MPKLGMGFFSVIHSSISPVLVSQRADLFSRIRIVNVTRSADNSIVSRPESGGILDGMQAVAS